MPDIDIECEEGDLFGRHIEQILKDPDMQAYGTDWKLWGRWIYARDIGLIGLLSRPYGQKEYTGAYAAKNGYQAIVEKIRTII